MLRGDGIIAGTSTTGTGTLTLAACPSPPGGVDFDVFARAMGFANSAAVVCGYTIIEYTDSTFATASKQEKGIGTLTLGGSSGIANCTLTRANMDHTATSLNSTATYNVSPGTGISIGTAANTLVFISPSVSDVMGAAPFSGADLSTFSRDGLGVGNWTATSGTSGTGAVVNQQIYYILVYFPTRKSITKARVRASATYTGQNNNIYVALYAMDSSANPSKLIADFGFLGTSNAAFASIAYIASAALATPIIVYPGFYIAAIHPIWTAGGSGTPSILHSVSCTGFLNSQVWGVLNQSPVTFLYLSSNATAAFADPATAPTAVQSTATFNQPHVWFGN